MSIADYTEADLMHVRSLLKKRYGKDVALELADSELQLDAESTRLSVCPTLYWNERGAHFVVCKTGESQYRCQFFYSDTEQYGTGRESYDDLEKCVMTLLQVQSDHERKLSSLSHGATVLKKLDDNYQGPVVV